MSVNKNKIEARYSVFHRLRKNVFLLRSPWIDIIQYAALVVVIVWLMSIGTARLGYIWHWYRVPRYLFTFKEGELLAGPLVRGLFLTLKISGISLVLSFFLGLGTALLRLSGSMTGRLLARGYLELIRNTPLLVQLFIMYFIVGPIFDIDRFMSAVLALSLFEGAYASEIFRAGIVSIHKGQWDASHSLGLSMWDTYRYVIFPQAIRRILPPLTNQAVALIKDSALVSLIALEDLTQQGRIVIAQTFLAFEIWFVIAAIYLIITVGLSFLVRYLEKRSRIVV